MLIKNSINLVFYFEPSFNALGPYPQLIYTLSIHNVAYGFTNIKHIIIDLIH